MLFCYIVYQHGAVSLVVGYLVALRDVMLCYVMLLYSVMLGYVLLHYVASIYVMFCHNIL